MAHVVAMFQRQICITPCNMLEKVPDWLSGGRQLQHTHIASEQMPQVCFWMDRAVGALQDANYVAFGMFLDARSWLLLSRAHMPKVFAIGAFGNGNQPYTPQEGVRALLSHDGKLVAIL